jgi:hypothetical protein
MDSYYINTTHNPKIVIYVVRIFRTVNWKAIVNPSIVAHCQNSEFIELSIFTSNDLNLFIVNVPKRHLVTITDLKFWGNGALYSALFTVKEIIYIQHHYKIIK